MRNASAANGLEPASRALLVLRVALLAALTASAALYFDYTSIEPAFCGARSGCGAVRGSGFGYLVLGESGPIVPLPAVGLLGFSLTFALSLVRGRVARSVTAWLSVLAGLVAIVLLALQAFAIGAFCALCVITDLAALVGAGAAVADLRAARRGRPSATGLPAWAWALLAVVCTAAPLVWPIVRPAPAVPAAVLEHYRPGKINVVELADFQCPFCRRLHGELKPLLSQYGDRVHFVRLNKPLASHEYAREAARAAVCGEAQGRGDQIADRLFEAESLTREANRELARSIGLDVRQFDACLDAPATDVRIDRESATLSPEDFQGLPTTFVGTRMIIGAQPAEVFREALERAARQDSDSGVPGWVYVVSVLALLLAIIAAGRAGLGSAPIAKP